MSRCPASNGAKCRIHRRCKIRQFVQQSVAAAGGRCRRWLVCRSARVMHGQVQSRDHRRRRMRRHPAVQSFCRRREQHTFLCRTRDSAAFARGARLPPNVLTGLPTNRAGRVLVPFVRSPRAAAGRCRRASAGMNGMPCKGARNRLKSALGFARTGFNTLAPIRSGNLGRESAGCACPASRACAGHRFVTPCCNALCDPCIVRFGREVRLAKKNGYLFPFNNTTLTSIPQRSACARPRAALLRTETDRTALQQHAAG